MKYILILAPLILYGCATPLPFQKYDYSKHAQFITNPEHIIVTTDDITDRQYSVLKDIRRTYGKATLLHEDPTPQHVDVMLKREAGRLGGDAVILVRYGSVGIGWGGWGELEGKGRVIKFIN